MPLTTHKKVTAGAVASNITWTGSRVRSAIIRQKSTNKCHISVTGTAVNNGVGCITLEGTVDKSIPIEFGSPNQTVSIIRDVSASGDATLEVWEYEP